MFLGISNIGWDSKYDTVIYQWMREYGYSGLEIAPTRVFLEKPYDELEKARIWSQKLEEQYGFLIPSMQSIWYGKKERLFGSQKERKELLAYTKKAIEFAAAARCRNLVFGCPKNRIVPEGADSHSAINFFREAGDFAAAHNTVIGMEANPAIYGTNYMNDTKSVLELVEAVGSKGFLLNLDMGTMIQNQETAEEIKGHVHVINHVHVSEPNLKPIQKRELHRDIFKVLQREHYTGCISIEMGKTDLTNIKNAMQYVREVFLDDL